MDGLFDGFDVGTLVVGLLLGAAEGDFDGFEVGTSVVGLLLGESDGLFDGFEVGTVQFSYKKGVVELSTRSHLLAQSHSTSSPVP